MSRVIRAKVESNSSDDKYARVKISAEGVWNETPLIESVGGIALKKGDYVFVDVTKVENPLILGRAMHKDTTYGKSIDGTLLFESSNGSKWTIGIVKNNKIEIINSEGSSILIDGTDIEIKGTVKVTGTSIEVSGTTVPGTNGPFNCLTNCAFTGVPHAGTKVNF